MPNPDLFGDYIAVCRWWQRFPTQSWVAAISGCDPLDIADNMFNTNANG